MLEDRLREMRAELDAFDDEFTKYSFLVELSAYVSADQPDLMRDEYLERGCQSRVWLRCREKDGILELAATSDTLIIRGVLYILQELFQGLTTSEVAQADRDVLEALGIQEHFSDERASGIKSIVRSIVSFCQSCQEGHAGD